MCLNQLWPDFEVVRDTDDIDVREAKVSELISLRAGAKSRMRELCKSGSEGRRDKPISRSCLYQSAKAVACF